jgi:hypothetical protein
MQPAASIAIAVLPATLIFPARRNSAVSLLFSLSVRTPGYAG